MEKVRWGIMGCGNISTTVAKAMSQLEEVSICAVAATDLNRAKQFATQFDVAKAYGTYEELVKDPEIEVIYIGTIHPAHYDCMKLCVQNGKHILCEKPFTLNKEEAEEIFELARQQGVFVMEAMWTKFLPSTIAIKDMIDGGRIGSFQYMRIVFGYACERSMSSRMFNPELGGGALLDVGIYPLTYAMLMAGSKLKSVESKACIGTTGIDEVNSMLLSFENGTIADCASAVSVNLGDVAVLYGTQGKIVIPSFFCAQKASLYDTNDALIEEIERPFLVNGYEYEIIEVNRCIREHKSMSQTHTWDMTLAMMELLDSMRKEWSLTYPGGK